MLLHLVTLIPKDYRGGVGGREVDKMIGKFMWKNKFSTIVKERKKKQNRNSNALVRALSGLMTCRSYLKCSMQGAFLLYKGMGRVKGPIREGEAPLAKEGRHWV